MCKQEKRATEESEKTTSVWERKLLSSFQEQFPLVKSMLFTALLQSQCVIGKERASSWVKRHGFLVPLLHHMICEIGQITWSAVPQFPYLWIQAFTICLLISTEILQGANSIMHIQVLCKIKSHQLLNMACPQFMPGPAFCCVRGAKEVTAESNHPSGISLCHPRFCHQETFTFANLTIKKCKVFNKPVLITYYFSDILLSAVDITKLIICDPWAKISSAPLF